MELNELKSTWKKVADKSASEASLDAAQLQELLTHKGAGIISRLHRNVKIGFGLLALFLVAVVVDSLLPRQFEGMPTPPHFLVVAGFIVDILLTFTFISFVVRYYRLKVPQLAANDMHTALKKVLQVISTFQKQFYLVMALFIFEAGMAFALGMYMGFMSVAGSFDLPTASIVFAVVMMLVILGLFVSLLIYIFHWGFRSLYGKYHQKLIDTLNELDELNSEKT